VVFVCTGNQARSPLAEALFRARAAGTSVEVVSFGTTQLPPSPALPEAALVGASLGIDLAAHRSRSLSPGALAESDLVIGFEPFHVAAAVVDGAAARERSFLIRELAGLLAVAPRRGSDGVDAAQRIEALDRLRPGRPMPSSLAMPDPAGQPARVFAALGEEIDEFTRRLWVEVFAAA
jgi:protein-tyrosine phosphatase